MASLGDGWQWLGCGWSIFRQNPLVWVVIGIVYLIVVMGLNLIPLVGQVAATLISPAIYAGGLLAARTAETGTEPSVEQLFQGLADENTRGRLLILGALFLVAQILVIVFLSLLLGASAVHMSQGGVEPLEGFTAGAALLVAFTGLALVTPLVMAFIYAGPLVLMRGATPITAFGASIVACLKNVIPLTVFSLIWLVLAIVAAIPFGLGFLVLVPWTFAAMYCSFDSIYGR